PCIAATTTMPSTPRSPRGPRDHERRNRVAAAGAAGGAGAAGAARAGSLGAARGRLDPSRGTPRPRPPLGDARRPGACQRAVAGGCGLATAHDFVVAAEDARFLYSEVRIGFVAALVATFLPLRLRGADIRELLLFPRFLDARQALAIGLVNRVVPPAGLAAVGETLAAEVLA